MADTFLYFAYGSNMFTRRLTERTPSAVKITSAFVEGHRLTFDKVSTDGSGKCDIEPTADPNSRAWGVIFRIASSEAVELDEAEGLGKGYEKREVQVVKSDGISSAAIAYLATKKDPSLQPYHWYKAFVVEGAIEHGLQNDYIEGLRAVISKPDPDAGRRTKNERLLSRLD
jgi:gamma-glutamylcyclotransferase